ncbi:MAG: DUF433 domain-containing protein [Chloroflexi bacterium]|nr:DUF433 domain-containing protein [Chloroflexota bacterium]
MIERSHQDRHALIAEYPDINGGYPVIAMTRIAVRLVVEAFRQLGNVDETVEAFPQLRSEQVAAALAYYEQYPQRVNEDTERNARALNALRAR